MWCSHTLSRFLNRLSISGSGKQRQIKSFYSSTKKWITENEKSGIDHSVQNNFKVLGCNHSNKQDQKLVDLATKTNMSGAGQWPSSW